MEVRVSDVDAQGHMSSASYVQFTNHALWRCVRAAGVDVDTMLDSGVGPVILETNLRYLAELRRGDQVDVSCELVFTGDRTYDVRHELRNAAGEVAATAVNRMGLLDLRKRRLLTEPAATWRRLAARPEALGSLRDRSDDNTEER
jgi:acyl-CoA thioester hydrolase